MEILQAVGAIFSILGIPSLWAVVFYLHKKHVAILQERMHLLEERSPEKLAKILESQKTLYETQLSMLEIEHRKELEKEKEQSTELIKKFEEEIKTLRTSLELMDKYWSGDDYRYDILKGQKSGV